jgi:hypothetical protein
MEEVNFVEEVPGWKSLSSKTIWASVRENENILKYFPDAEIKRTPQRLNVQTI